MAVRTSFTAGEVLAAADLNDTFGAKLNLAGGKVLQIVRATDVTDRTTTSGTYVDASLSVTITPQRNTSSILLIATFLAGASGDYMSVAITDSSNNLRSGAQRSDIRVIAGGLVVIGYVSPATLVAQTYKCRFLIGSSGTASLFNSLQTGQLYAIEVSA